MKILIVEDDEATADALVSALHSSVGDLHARVEGSRDEGLDALEGDDFDLIVCDLRLPPRPNDLDVAEEHGFAVHSAVRARRPGTPLIFFTGFATTRNIREQLATGGMARLFGVDQRPLVQLVEKDDPDECVQLVVQFAQDLYDLVSQFRIDVEEGDHLDDLSWRAVALYGRQIHATSARLRRFRGLSGARTSRIEYFDSDNATIANVFCKVDDRTSILNELNCYDTYVPTLLQPGTYAPTAAHVVHNLRSDGALFLSLADKRESLFDMMRHDADGAATIAESLREAMRPWRTPGGVTTVTVGELRRRRAPDSMLVSIPYEADRFARIEARVIAIRECVQHGDLHGGNVLVADQSAVLIDFADVSMKPICLDPLTLELSLIFHVDGPAREGNWPTLEHLSRWANVEEFVIGSPYASFIQKCRSWSLSVADEESVLAVAYAHAMRQLKYSDVDPQWALAVARSAVDALSRW